MCQYLCGRVWNYLHMCPVVAYVGHVAGLFVSFLRTLHMGYISLYLTSRK